MAVVRTCLLTLLALTVLLTSGISGDADHDKKTPDDADHAKEKPDEPGFCHNVAEDWRQLKEHVMSQRWGETSIRKLEDRLERLSRRGEFSPRYRHIALTSLSFYAPHDT